MDIYQLIDQDRDQIIQDLIEFIALQTCDGTAIPQADVIERFNRMGMDIDTFQDGSAGFSHLSDYCPTSKTMHPLTKNVVATSKETSKQSLLLFAHIDTESLDYYQNNDPTKIEMKDGKLFGHGVCDDKAGVMMIIHALEYLHRVHQGFPGKITVMSVLGKHGGSSGTLSALMRGHRGDFGLYIHPAETGDGWNEIKNISLGVIDFILTIYGSPGTLHDDLDPGMNSIVLAAQVVVALENYNQQKRIQHRFPSGMFQGQPSSILNVGKISGGSSGGSVSLETRIEGRIRFFFKETVDSVFNDLTNYLHNQFPHIQMDIQKGDIRANPSMVDFSHPELLKLKRTITHFIPDSKHHEMYHGASDIRLPFLYANCPTVGVGPLGYLPTSKSKQREWIDLDSYIAGIKILISFIQDYFK